jgi:hypothetical protein
VGRGAGLVLGVPLGWIAAVCLNFGTDRITLYRSVRFAANRGSTTGSILLLVFAAVALALLLSSRSPFSSGALVGAGAVLAGAGLLMQIAPIDQAAKLANAFTVGDEPLRGVPLWDGSLLFLGVFLVVLGIRRWRSAVPSYAGGPHSPNPVPPVFGGPRA